MITTIKIDGFKSLSKFELKLKPGLNILVGPNGAGKTNIVMFFEFLSNLMDGELSEALSKIGGAGSILKKTGEETYQPYMDVNIQGEKQRTKKKKLTYSYDFRIELSGHNLIYFKHQRFKIVLSSLKEKDKSKNLDPEPSLDIEQSITKELKQDIILHKYDRSKFRTYLYPERISKKNFEKFIKDYLEKFNLLSNSLVTAIIRILDVPYAFDIRADLRGGETFNIIPSEVKKPEDVAKAPGIQKDGSGLAATLYAMEVGKSRGPFRERLYLPRFLVDRDPSKSIFNPKTLKKVIENVKLANNSISNIHVVNEPFSNNLNVKITIKEEGGKEATLPLSLMSDGTIKWMTLITAILTCRNIFSIEEPENYLHPWMQSEIVKIMRNSIREDSFILMTTHSESLLNSAEPEEIIVVSMEDGKTYAKRIKNIKLLREEISNTGFGLAYFYVSDTIESE